MSLLKKRFGASRRNVSARHYAGIKRREYMSRPASTQKESAGSPPQNAASHDEGLNGSRRAYPRTNLPGTHGGHEGQRRVRTSTLRMLISAVRNKESRKRKALAEADILDVIQAEAKRRKNRLMSTRKSPERLGLEGRAELNVLKVYLPQSLSEPS